MSGVSDDEYNGDRWFKKDMKLCSPHCKKQTLHTGYRIQIRRLLNETPISSKCIVIL